MKRVLSILMLSTIFAACGGHVDGDGLFSGPNGSSADGTLNPCGSAARPTAIAASPIQDARAVAVDATHLYWTTWGEEDDQDHGMIFAAPLGGGTAVALATDAGVTTSLAINANDVFWIDWGRSIRKVSKSGGATTTLVSGSVLHLAVDEDYVYFTSTSGLERVPTAGGAREVLAPNDAAYDAADAIAIDDAYVYWVSALADGMVERVAKSGGTPDIVARGDFHSTTIAVDATSVYVSNMDSGTLLAVPKVGGAETVLSSALRCPDTVRVDASGVYVSNDAVACPNVDDSDTDRGILRVPQATAARATQFGIDGEFAIDARRVYFAGRDGPTSAIFCSAK